MSSDAALLAWLNAEEDADIVVPCPEPPSVTTRTSQPPIGSRTTAVQSSTTVEVMLMPCELQEAERRRLVVEAEGSDRLDLLRLMFTSQPCRPSSETTFEHNRRLCVNDLVSDLYESNKSQREQLHQMLAMFAQVQGNQAGSTRRRGR